MTWGAEKIAVLNNDGMAGFVEAIISYVEREGFDKEMMESRGDVLGSICATLLSALGPHITLVHPDYVAVVSHFILTLGYMLAKAPHEFEAIYNEMVAQYGTHSVEIQK